MLLNYLNILKNLMSFFYNNKIKPKHKKELTNNEEKAGGAMPPTNPAK